MKHDIYPVGSELVLLIKCRSGNVYRTQAGGCACDHPEEEGIVLHLPVPAHLVDKLSCLTVDSLSLDEDDRIKIDRVLMEFPWEHIGLKFRCAKNYPSEEAWVHVDILGDNALASLKDIVGSLDVELDEHDLQGVLIFANSD